MSSQVKCLVWDLDDTLWTGILMEDPDVALRPEAVETIRRLDERGILHSIASRNDEEKAIQKLRAFGIDDYFLYPQIDWGSKSDSIDRIAELLGLGPDALAFVDDDPFEREGVAFSCPEVRCFDAADVVRLAELPEFRPGSLTDEARKRRLLYKAQERRLRAEEAYPGPKQEFLETLEMVFSMWPASREDLERAAELTVRTHQLNTTGRTYSQQELEAFVESPEHLVLMASLQDRFGDYGKIGMALVEMGADAWTLKLLLMSCRVVGRGAGGLLLNEILRIADRRGVRLRAELVPNDRNRMMLVTLRFAGFRKIGQAQGVALYEHDPSKLPGTPRGVTVRIEGLSSALPPCASSG